MFVEELRWITKAIVIISSIIIIIITFVEELKWFTKHSNTYHRIFYEYVMCIMRHFLKFHECCNEARLS